MTNKNPILPILTTILGSSDFFDLFKGNKQKEREFALKIAEKLENQNLQQIEVNKIEAKHDNIFVSGWRPSVGWICSLSIGYNFILQPFLLLILQIFNLDIKPPILEIEQLISILTALLGMFTYRTYEKVKLNK